MEASIKALEEAADHATLKALLDAAKPVGFDKQPTWRAAYVKRFEELKKAVQA